MKYETVIGLEIHAELKTRTKMFCDSLNDPNEKHPNINVCPICMGHPGTLPVINKKAIESVIKVGLAIGSEIPEFSKFDRKNYFYPDLPKGYQISQYDKPLCLGGSLNIGEKIVQITRVHLEEDTGKNIHPVKGRGPHGTLRPEGADYSLVDFNRAGVPLMELVTEPEIRSSEEARTFAQNLQLLLRYLGVSDANMEKGEMRCEANISLRPKGKEKFGTKVEVKNLNSFKAVEGAIKYETQRQSEVLESGDKVIQETRGWDEKKQRTFSQRSKEEAHDYRYFPEPDLPPLRIGRGKDAMIDVEKLRGEIPELPQQRHARFKEEYGLKDEDIDMFVASKPLGEYYEKVVSELAGWLEAEQQKTPRPIRRAQGRPEELEGRQARGREDHETISRLTANYITSDLQKLMSDASASATDLLITPENFAELITLIHTNKVSSRVAKDVLKEMFGNGADPSQIIEEKGLSQVSDESQLESIVEEAIKQNPQAIEDYKKGKDASIQFLVGQVMRETKGAANPSVVKKIILMKIK